MPGLPIPQSLCCLKFQLRRAHYPVRTVRRTVRAQCRAHFRAPHWQCTVPTGGKGRPSGLPRLARSAQIHSKCLPHSPPTGRAQFSTILQQSQPFSQSQLQVCTHPLPSYKVVKVDKAPQAPSCTHSQDHVSAVHGVPEIAASLRLHLMPSFNLCSCGPGPEIRCTFNHIGYKIMVMMMMV